MPIYSFADLRQQAGEAWANRSDEDLITEYASQLKVDPVQLANNLGYNPKVGGISSQRFSSALDRYQAGLYGFAEEATGAVGLDRVSNYLAEQRRANELAADVSSLRARNQGAVDEWKDVNSVSDFGSYVTGLGIQSIPYAAEAFVGGIGGRLAMGGTRAALTAGQEALTAARGAGDIAAAAQARTAISEAGSALRAGGTAGAVGASYPSAVGDILSNQREQAGETSPAAAFALGVPYAAANAFGLEGAAARSQLFRNTINILDRPGGITGGLTRATATGVTTGLKEGASETFQEGMNQLGRMAVDPNENFLSEAAQGRFKESFIGGGLLGGTTGAALGGWRRSTNDIQQTLNQSGNTPFTNAAPPPPAVPPPPAGTTPLSQNLAAAQQNQQAEANAEALSQQRAAALSAVGATISDDNGGTLTVFGKPIIGQQQGTLFGNYLSAALQSAPAPVRMFAKALAEANDAVGGKLVSFEYNGTNPEASAKRLIVGVQRALSGLQLSSATTVEQAAGVLNTLSKTAKGQQLDKINAVFQALTGQNTEGYVASQKPKGVVNGQQLLQTPAGVGTVPEQGTTGAANGGTAGNVRPGNVQPLGAGSQPQGQTGEQAGQLPTEGIRAGSGVASDVYSGGGQGSTEVTSLITGAPSGQITQTATEQNTAGINGSTTVRAEGAAENGGRSGQVADGKAVDKGKAPEVSQRAKQLWEDMDVSGVQYDQLPPGMRDAWDLAVSRNSATGEIQEQIAAEAADLSNESRVGKLLRGILEIIIRPTSRMPEDVAAKKREFFLAYYGGARNDTLAVAAKDLGISPSQAHRWSAELNTFAEKYADKLSAAADAVMKDQNISEDEMLAVVAALQTRTSVAQTATEEDLEKERAGEKNPDERLSSDEIGSNAEMKADGKRSFAEEAPATEEDTGGGIETELGVVVKNQTTSAQEQFNAVDTNNAKVLAILEALNTIDEREESPRADMVKRAQEKLDAANGDLTTLAPGQAKDLALDAYANGNEEVGDSIVAMLNERLEAALGTGTKQAAKQTQKATEETKKEPKKVTKPKTVRKAKAETKPAAEPIQTMEAAGEAWNAGVADYPTAPKWDQLTEEQQKTFFDFGVDNWTKEDVANELVKLAKEGAKFGVAATEAEVKNPYTAKELIAELAKFIRADIIGRKLIVVDSVEDLLNHPDADIRAIATALANKGAYGVATNGTAYLIANRIEKGRGRGKFMHEVGAHLGLERLLPKALYNKLVSQIKEWAASDEDTKEVQLAKAAQARVEAAQTEQEDVDAELLAYFVEVASDAGIDPTAASLKESSALREWFRTLWAAFKVAVRKLGFKPEALTSQDVIDLAFGAARLEMTGTFHGTAAKFRKFSHAFMNTGEGAQVYGWGSYLAQAPGIAKWYWRQDVGRKSGAYDNDGNAIYKVGNEVVRYPGDTASKEESDRYLAIEFLYGASLARKGKLAIAQKAYSAARMSNPDSHPYIKQMLDNNTIPVLGTGDVKGSLMRVDVGVDQNDMLDWDTPLGEQPIWPKLKANLSFDVTDSMGGLSGIPLDDMTGKEFYETLVRIEKSPLKIVSNEFADVADYNKRLAKRNAAGIVSAYLDEVVGIPGIKFFDSNSRGFNDVSGLRRSIDKQKSQLAELLDNNVEHLNPETDEEYTEKELAREIERTRAKLENLEAQLARELAENEKSTRNLVVFNDKDIFRVGGAESANRQRLRFGIAGEVSLQINPDKKLLSKLQTAKTMQSAGKSVDEIWKATGWYRGEADNKWRYEIPDTNAKLLTTVPKTPVDIATVLGHDALFDKYPMLTASSGVGPGITIEANDSMPENAAVFMPAAGRIVVSSKTGKDELLKTILHELQHAIQSVERFAEGGGPDNVVIDGETIQKLAAGIRERMSANDPSLPTKFDASKLATMLDKLAQAFSDFQSTQLTLEEEFAKKAVNRNLSKRQLTNLQDELNQQIAEAELRLDATIDRLVNTVPGLTLDDLRVYLYQQIAGELEARLVEQRVGMTKAELKATPPVPAVSIGNTLTARLNYNNEIEFHKTSVLSVDAAVSKLPTKLQAPTKSLLATLFSNAKDALLATALTDDVVAMASKFMKSAKTYLTAQYARQAVRAGVERRVDKILTQYEKLPKALQGDGAGSVNEFIHDMTMSKQWGFYPGAHRVGRSLFTINIDLQARFSAFPPEAQQLIRDTFEHGYEMLMLKQKALTAALDRAYKDRLDAAAGDPDATKALLDAKAKDARKQAKLFELDTTVPYAHLSRYGDFVVVAKSKEFTAAEEVAKGGRSRVVAAATGRPGYVLGDPQAAREWLAANYANPEHYIVQFVETQGEADALAAKLIATGKYDIQPEDAGAKEAQASYNGSDLFLAVSRLKNLADRTDATSDAHINKLLSDLVLMTAAESSFRKSELVRKSVSGADKNMMRNLATSGRADAHMLSVLMHGEEITDALEAMRDEARQNRREAMPIYNELFKRHAASLDYKTPKALPTALIRMSSLFYLALNPAYYMQQILQTSVLSVPYMAGRLGYFNAARQTQQAYKDITALTKNLNITDAIDFSKAPADVRVMLEALIGMGKIDTGMDAEGKAFAGEEGTFPAVMRKLQAVNARIESINRAVAAVAAYRGYTKRYGVGNPQAAIEYAAEVVSNSHGSYDGFTTPRILTGNVSRVMLQFKRFQIVQLSMLAKTIHAAFKGASPEERKVARKTLQFIAAHMAVLGGALGVPFVYQVSWILAKLFGDEPDDPEAMLRRIIGNQKAADLLLKGAPYAILGIDLGSKLAMQNAASILPFVDADLSRSGLEKIYVGLLGPSAALSLKMADGLGLMGKGDYYKGLEMVMPNGIANVMKAGRYAVEGVTMRNGDLVLRPEEVSMVDAAFQAVGLPTDTITRRMFTQKLVKDMDEFYQQKTTEIKRDYVEAFRKGDSAAMGDARREWEEMQTSRTRNGYTRQSASTLFKAPMEVAKKERSVVGGVETTRQNKAFVERVSQL